MINPAVAAGAMTRAALRASPEKRFGLQPLQRGLAVQYWIGAARIVGGRIGYDWFADECAMVFYEYLAINADEYFFKMPEDDKRTLLLIVANAIIQETNHD